MKMNRNQLNNLIDTLKKPRTQAARCVAISIFELRTYAIESSQCRFYKSWQLNI